ncbi:MAG: hypothetical protein ACFFDN_06335 [Candidatus Hodarchaeota archaeon]
MKKIYLIIFFALFINKINAGEQFRYNITIDNRYFYNDIDENSKINPGNSAKLSNYANDLRAYLKFDFTKNKLLNFHYQSLYNNYYSKTNNFKNHFYLFEGYWDYSLSDQILIRLGKQHAKWGSGYAWNPTNTIEPKKDPTQPEEIMEGITAAKIHFLYRDFYLTTIGLLNDESEKLEFALKVGALINEFDISFNCHRRYNRNWIGGLDFVGFISDLEIHGEFAAQKGSDRWYPDQYGQFFQKSYKYIAKYLIGCSYTLSSNIMFILEYFRDEEGFNATEMKNFITYLPMTAPLYRAVNMQKNNLFFAVTKTDMSEILMLQGILLTNLNNLNTIFLPEITYSPIQSFSIALRIQFGYNGIRKSEQDLSPIPNAIRLKSTLYF